MNSNDALKLNETTMMFEVPYTNKTNRLTRLVTIIDNAKSNVVVYVKKNYVDLLAVLVTNAFVPEKRRHNTVQVHACGQHFRREGQLRIIEEFNTSPGLNVLIIDYLDRSVLNAKIVVNYETSEDYDDYIDKMELSSWMAQIIVNLETGEDCNLYLNKAWISRHFGLRPVFNFNFIVE